MSLSFNSATGFVPLDYAPSGASRVRPGRIRPSERRMLRDLAARVAAVAAEPAQRVRRDLWTRHNRLAGLRPMVFVVVEAAWHEVLPQRLMEVEDPFWRQWEWFLRQLLYRHDNIKDDFVTLAELRVPVIFEDSGWGLQMRTTMPRETHGAFSWETVLNGPSDLEAMHYPRISVDREASERNCSAVAELFSGILPVRLHERIILDTALVPVLTNLRGLERTLLDMHDDPRFIHRIMSFITAGVESVLDEREAGDLRDSNNENDYIGSGGLGFSDELAAAQHSPRQRTLRDMWGFAAAQEFTGISPSMFEEFAVRYQARLLKRFGIVSYGCCERLDDRIDMLSRNIPNLRRVSVSPFADRGKSAEALGDRYIYSWKPNPAYHVACPRFSEENVRADIRETLEAARGCHLEIILKDTETVNRDPGRLSRWSRIAMEMVGA